MRSIIAGIFSLAIAAVATPVLAHHPFESEFDAKAPITLTGKIVSIDWSDPHVIIKMDAKDGNGPMKTWDLQAASPSEMVSMGWTMTTLKAGEEVTVSGYKAKAEPTTIAARLFTMPNGNKMVSAASDGGPRT